MLTRAVHSRRSKWTVFIFNEQGCCGGIAVYSAILPILTQLGSQDPCRALMAQAEPPHARAQVPMGRTHIKACSQTHVECARSAVRSWGWERAENRAVKSPCLGSSSFCPIAAEGSPGNISSFFFSSDPVSPFVMLIEMPAIMQGSPARSDLQRHPRGSRANSILS